MCVCVCSELPSPGRGREAAVSAATSERAKQLSNFACAAPLPRAARPGRGLRSAWGPGAGPGGEQTRAQASGRGPGWSCGSGTATPGSDWGCASTHSSPGNDARSPPRVPAVRTPPTAPTRSGWAREGGGGWRRSHGNCAGWINTERASGGCPQTASISAADAEP